MMHIVKNQEIFPHAYHGSTLTPIGVKIQIERSCTFGAKMIAGSIKINVLTKKETENQQNSVCSSNVQLWTDHIAREGRGRAISYK